MITGTALLVEYTAPALILWPRGRGYVAAGLVLFHLTMWPLLALGSFPLVMVVALVTLVPGGLWDRIGWRLQSHSEACLPGRWSIVRQEET